MKQQTVGTEAECRDSGAHAQFPVTLSRDDLNGATCSTCCLRSLIAVFVQAIDMSGDILEHVI
jgi:hypothetical protein